MDRFVEADAAFGQAVAEVGQVVWLAMRVFLSNMSKNWSISTGSRGVRERDRLPGLDLCLEWPSFQRQVLQADRGDRLHDRSGVHRQRFDALFELQLDDRGDPAGLRVLLGAERVHDAHARTADAHLVALDAGPSLGQFGLDVVGGHERQAVVGVVGEVDGDDHDQRRDRPDQQRAAGQRALAAAVHGVCVGSQPSLPLSVNGEEPSAAGWVAAPGQRRSWPVFRPSHPAAG